MNFLKTIEEQIGTWSVPEIIGDIPHGDMPGDKVEIGQSHIEKSTVIFPALLPLLRDAMSASASGHAVVSVYGGSGVGKSEIASLITYYLNKIGVGAYTLSGDNYPRRIPVHNDAERLGIYRTEGIHSMIANEAYSTENAEVLKELWISEKDADPAMQAEYPWLKLYQDGGRTGLEQFLGSSREQNFEELNLIIRRFRNGGDSMWLKRMGRTDIDLWYEEIDFRSIGVLVIEWTHGNNAELRGIDIPIYLHSTPEETREHRRARGRDGKTDSAFTTVVLEVEQELLASQAHTAKLIVSKSGKILSWDEYKQMMESGGQTK